VHNTVIISNIVVSKIVKEQQDQITKYVVYRRETISYL